MRLRAAKLKDATSLGLIMARWIAQTDWMPKLHTAKQDIRFLEHLIKTQDVTVLAGVLSNYGFMARHDEIIHALYLAPKARGRGWGHQMLEHAKSGADRLELWAFQQNIRARRFYARAGFEEVEETNGQGNDEKLPDVRMVWERTT